jgi:4-alpha-glucanotransferase
VCRDILVQHLYSPAMWAIFQWQDLMSISPELRRDNPEAERINVPSNSYHSWRYRMHINYTVNAVVIVLKRSPVLDRSKIVSYR